MTQRKLLILGVSVAIAAACGKSDDKKTEPKEEDRSLGDKAKDGAKDLSGKAAHLADEAREGGRNLRDKAGALRDKAGALRDRAGALRDKAQDLAGRAREAGDDAIAVVRPYAAKTKGQVENVIVDGKQVATKAAKMATEVGPAIADGVGFRPIYVDIGDSGQQAAIDQAIGAMPRVEVIDGLTVGFRAFTKRQFLVVWRHDDHLVGFVYTSLTDVVIEHVVEQAPRLIALARKVTG